jgi:hypothetical protein
LLLLLLFSEVKEREEKEHEEKVKESEEELSNGPMNESNSMCF